MRDDVTHHEAEARYRFAALVGMPEERWTIVDRPEPLCWYDFFDPATGAYGQCCVARDGTWKQDPRGKRPVILAFRPAGRKAVTG